MSGRVLALAGFGKDEDGTRLQKVKHNEGFIGICFTWPPTSFQ